MSIFGFSSPIIVTYQSYRHFLDEKTRIILTNYPKSAFLAHWHMNC